MEGYTFFKTSDGSIYGVSERVMSLGYRPNEDVVYASDAEIEDFTQKANDATTKEEKITRAQTLLDNKLISEKAFTDAVELISNEPDQPVVEEPVVEITPELIVEVIPEPVVEDTSEPIVEESVVKRVNPFVSRLLKMKEDLNTEEENN